MADYQVTIRIRVSDSWADEILTALEGAQYKGPRPRWEGAELVLVYSCEAATDNEARDMAARFVHDVARLAGLYFTGVRYVVDGSGLDPPIDDGGLGRAVPRPGTELAGGLDLPIDDGELGLPL